MPPEEREGCLLQVEGSFGKFRSQKLSFKVMPSGT